MEIKIFNVEHGFCALITSDSGQIILIDCGTNNTTGFSPSAYLSFLGYRLINKLIITNFDEDHLSDLNNIFSLFVIGSFHRNPSIDPGSLKRIKLQNSTLSHNMETYLTMHSSFVHEVSECGTVPGININHFWNKYPLFQDSNNLSLVTFMQCGNINIVFPGDIEKQGWEALLASPLFCYYLRKVNIFVASHHGRENGYHSNVFSYCKPDLVVISDESIQYDTQETEYCQHANGKFIPGTGVRYSLTTRNDGVITIIADNNDYFVMLN